MDKSKLVYMLLALQLGCYNRKHYFELLWVWHTESLELFSIFIFALIWLIFSKPCSVVKVLLLPITKFPYTESRFSNAVSVFSLLLPYIDKALTEFRFSKPVNVVRLLLNNIKLPDKELMFSKPVNDCRRFSRISKCFPMLFRFSNPSNDLKALPFTIKLCPIVILLIQLGCS